MKNLILALSISLGGVPAIASFQTFAPADARLNAVAAKLPSSLKELVSQVVSIDTMDANKAGSISKLCLADGSISYGDSQAILGMTRVKGGSAKITLHQDLVQPQNSRSSCSRAQLDKLLERTLIHEMAHVFDNTAPARNCSEDDTSYSCARTHRVSDDLRFVLMAGFKPMVRDDVLSSKAMNVYFDRSPRSYEGVNPQEYFAVNFEYFILDSEYKCRRPATAEYLQKVFGFDPYPQVTCGRVLKVLSPGGEIVKLNLDKIYQVQYMHAASTKQLQSMFGHSQMRLVVCAPEHDLGPQCLNDIQHHIAVDFTATITDGKLNVIGGITGKYPTGINFRKFTQLEADTVVKQDRTITSMAMGLSRSELETFVKVVAEKYWGQISRYKFIANNCATQVLYATLSSVNRQSVDQNESTTSIFAGAIITPNWVTKYFRKVGILAAEGYFPEDTTVFATPSQVAEKYASVLGNRKVEHILSYTTQQREWLYLPILQSTKLTADQKTELKDLFFEIEQLAAAKLATKNSAIFSSIQQRIATSKMVGDLPKVVRIGAVNPEWEGYGIPQNLETVREQLLEKRKESLAYIKNIIQAFTTPTDKAAIDQIEKEKEVQQQLVMKLLSL